MRAMFARCWRAGAPDGQRGERVLADDVDDHAPVGSAAVLLWPGGSGGVLARLDVVELLLRGERAALPGGGERLRLGALRGLRAPADELRLGDRVVLLPRELLRRGERERLQARGGVGVPVRFRLGMSTFRFVCFVR